MAKDPAFLFYTQDFITGTLLMTNEEIGIYIKLLCVQHQHGGIIDKRSFKSIVGSHELITSKFIETEEGFFNERLMSEMSKRSVKSTNLSANAKKGWEKRCKSNAEASNRHMPIEDEDEIVNVVKNKALFSFKDVWDLYPNKLGRKEAERHFKASVLTDKDFEDIKIAINKYLLHTKMLEPRFIKNGSSWFNNWRDWIDYIAPSACSKCKGKGKFVSTTGYEIVCDCKK